MQKHHLLLFLLLNNFVCLYCSVAKDSLTDTYTVNRLCDEINSTSAVKNAAYVGRVLDVLCDGPSKRNSRSLSGRTDTFKLVNFKGDPALAGEIVKVRITSSNTFSLEGELV